MQPQRRHAALECGPGGRAACICKRRSLTSSSACTVGKNEAKADETDAKSDEPSAALLLAETVKEVDMAAWVGREMGMRAGGGGGGPCARWKL
jgi:hypothetical protein